MRCGILIIGSLLWETKKNGRAAWRQDRLNVAGKIPVKAPFYYGRKASKRGNTFTMVFGTDEPSAQGVLVPCAKEFENINGLTEEAQALWKAEDPKAKPGCIHKSWGCVGALFGPKPANSSLMKEWTNFFRKVKAQCVSIVDSDGKLNIPWPNTMDGQPVDLDVILATSTKLEEKRPTAQAIADAWIGQCNGNESYFFNNVQDGIRTSDDSKIWCWIEECSPYWLKAEAYKEAIEILRSEDNGMWLERSFKID